MCIRDSYNSSFVENSSPGGSSMFLDWMYSMNHCLLVWGDSPPSQGDGSGMIVTCNDLFGNIGGDYTGPMSGYLGLDGNFQADPQFCGITDGYLALQSDSPCAPENSPCPNELIGALPVGCGEQAAQAKSWGAVKRLY